MAKSKKPQDFSRKITIPNQVTEKEQPSDAQIARCFDKNLSIAERLKEAADVTDDLPAWLDQLLYTLAHEYEALLCSFDWSTLKKEEPEDRNYFIEHLAASQYVYDKYLPDILKRKKLQIKNFEDDFRKTFKLKDEPSKKTSSKGDTKKKASSKKSVGEDSNLNTPLPEDFFEKFRQEPLSKKNLSKIVFKWGPQEINELKLILRKKFNAIKSKGTSKNRSSKKSSGKIPSKLTAFEIYEEMKAFIKNINKMVPGDFLKELENEASVYLRDQIDGKKFSRSLTRMTR